MIYKDGGCNHIWSCPCDFHWCWQVSGTASALTECLSPRSGVFLVVLSIISFLF